MEKIHFDSETWGNFAKDKLSPSECDYLLEHLQEDCETCEKFLFGLEQEEFNATIRDVTGKLAGTIYLGPGPNGNDRKAMFSEIVEQSRKNRYFNAPFSGWKPLVFSTALLATLALVVVVTVLIPLDRWGEKGGRGRLPSILLQVVVLKHNADVPERGMKGDKYDPKDILFFRYEITKRSYVYIVRLNDGQIEVIHSPDPANPIAQDMGIYDFREGNEALGFHLSGLEGRQVFVAIAGIRPLDINKEIGPLLQIYMKGGKFPMSEKWAISSFEIMVEKPQ